MSGNIFQPMETPDDSGLSGATRNQSNFNALNLDEAGVSNAVTAIRNPLLCYLCNIPYEDPRIFACFHSFCAHCLRGRANDGKITCPLCGFSHTLKDGAVLPPSDLLLKFMVESSTEEKAQCANCDSASHQMFFCNTCSQPLCSTCREETHRAKMFSAHDMVLLTKRAREVHKKCALHGEPYIMFSSEKKIMLCINCFRDMRIESRGHCLDLETAYKQSCKKLDMRVQAFRDLQSSVRDGVFLFRALLEEIKTNADNERAAIDSLTAKILSVVEETKQMLQQKVNSDYTEKEAAFHSQLRSLSSLLPTLQLNLVIASAFSGSANKFEFLDLAYVLMDRLKSIVQKKHPIHPTQSGQIDSAYKTEFFKSLEPLLYVPLARHMHPSSNSNGNTSATPGSSCPNSPISRKVTPQRRPHPLNGAKVKFIDAKGSFAEHCREFETAHRDLLKRFEQIKSQCQELQRDLTMRRCLARKEEVSGLGEKITTVQEQLESHRLILEGKQPLLERHWEESLERIGVEQDLYQAQLQDVNRLKSESQHLHVIASQLSSFVSSIAAVTERLAPKLGRSSLAGEQEQHMYSLMDEINALMPDSDQRVEAIQTAEEERQTILASRTNPLDNELKKTKGLLRAPSLRDKKGERWRKDAKEIVEKSQQLLQGNDCEIKSGLVVREAEASVSVKSTISGENDNDNNTSTLLVGETQFLCPITKSSKICDSCFETNNGKEKKSSRQESEICSNGDAMSTENIESNSYVALSLTNGKHICCESDSSDLAESDAVFKTGIKVKEDKVIMQKKSGSGDASLRASSEVDNDVIKNLLKDIENVKKRESVQSPTLIANGTDSS